MLKELIKAVNEEIDYLDEYFRYYLSLWDYQYGYPKSRYLLIIYLLISTLFWLSIFKAMGVMK